MKLRTILCGTLVFILLFALISLAQARSPQETLNQYISDLQKNPNDNALRETIIKHVQTMKPKPAIPEEARKHFVMGNSLQKDAKVDKDYALAIDEYRQALLIAPWIPQAYNNLGLVYDAHHDYDKAIASLKLYLLTNPDDARQAQDKIYEIKAHQKKLAEQVKEESSPEAAAAQQQKKFEDLLNKIDGRRYTRNDQGFTMVVDVKGKFLVFGQISPRGNYQENDFPGRVEIRGRETTVHFSFPGGPSGYHTFTISEDGGSITWFQHYNTGVETTVTYLWQGQGAP